MDLASLGACVRPCWSLPAQQNHEWPTPCAIASELHGLAEGWCLAGQQPAQNLHAHHQLRGEQAKPHGGGAQQRRGQQHQVVPVRPLVRCPMPQHYCRLHCGRQAAGLGCHFSATGGSCSKTSYFAALLLHFCPLHVELPTSTEAVHVCAAAWPVTDRIPLLLCCGHASCQPPACGQSFLTPSQELQLSHQPQCAD